MLAMYHSHLRVVLLGGTKVNDKPIMTEGIDRPDFCEGEVTRHLSCRGRLQDLILLFSWFYTCSGRSVIKDVRTLRLSSSIL
jgi:hypothetical protein